ncbi:MAG TPA: hypothetical protein VNL17_11455 [Verrucomicrobiae bacterium]|nr:hypothetical protein [Verrucomicrobiae bacterium]
MSQSLSFRHANRSVWLRGVLFSAFFLGALLSAEANNLGQVGGYTNANTAVGDLAMDLLSVGGDGQTAVGYASLYFSNGTNNTGVGHWSLLNLASGDRNTGLGDAALGQLTNGNNNIALGFQAGTGHNAGDNNIDIGNSGVDGESNVIRLGNETHTAAFIAGVNGTSVTNGAAVVVDANGQLGTASIPPSGAYLQLPSGTAAPAGYTKLGTIKLRYKNSLGKGTVVLVDLYQKQ